MNSQSKLPEVIKEINLREILRVDYSMEGDWNQKLNAIWSKEEGFLGYEGMNVSHENHKPCVELYFDGYWLGIHCYEQVDNQNVFDEEKASLMIKYIEENS